MGEAKYITLENFGFGLDTRKSMLTSQPGTLLVLNNGHVNQGGELEKRKAFTVLGGVALPAGCFGLEISAVGITTFGSIATPAAFTGGGAFAGLVNYQRLQSPLGTAMSSVIGSTSFSGDCWVIAAFNAGAEVYAFYNGTLIPDFTDGLILASLNTNALIAAALVTAINRTSSVTGYSAVQDVGPNTNELEITGTIGGSFSSGLSKTSAAGVVTATESAVSTQSSPGVAASGQFQVVGGDHSAGVNKVTTVSINGTACLSSSVDWITSNNQTAQNLASNINGHSGTSGYTAQATGSVVSLFALASVGAGANGFIVSVTAAGNVCIGSCSVSITGPVANPASQTVSGITANNIDLSAGSGWPAAQPDLATLCAAVAAVVNTNTGTTGYIAFAPAGQNTIFFSKAVTRSDDLPVALQLSVSITTTGGGVVTGSNPALVVNVTNTLTYVATKGNGGSGHSTFSETIYVPTLSATAVVVGGTGNGYILQWTVLSGSTVSLRNPNGLTSYQLNSIITGSGFGLVQGTLLLQCGVTDSGGNVALSTILAILVKQPNTTIP